MERLRKKEPVQYAPDTMAAESAADAARDFIICSLSTISKWTEGEPRVIEMHQMAVTLDWILGTCGLNSPWNPRADGQVAELLAKLREIAATITRGDKKGRLAARIADLQWHFDSSDGVRLPLRTRVSNKGLGEPQRGVKRPASFDRTVKGEASEGQNDQVSKRLKLERPGDVDHNEVHEQDVKMETTAVEAERAHGEPLTATPIETQLATMDSETETEDEMHGAGGYSSTETEDGFDDIEPASTAAVDSVQFRAPALGFAAQINKAKTPTRRKEALADLVSSLDTSFKNASDQALKNAMQFVDPFRKAVKLSLHYGLKDDEIAKYEEFCRHAVEFSNRATRQTA